MEFAHQKTVSGEEIRQLRKKLDFTQKNFAAFANVSVKTVQHWESGKKEVSGPIVALLKILKEHPQLKDELMIPEKKYPLRLKYFCGNDLEMFFARSANNCSRSASSGVTATWEVSGSVAQSFKTEMSMPSAPVSPMQ